MAEGTQTEGTPNTPSAFGYCAWHKGHSRGVRLVRVHEQGSGPGTAGSMFACHPCQIAHGLVPLADRPL
ncbi:hypothetical protein [Streptomyces mirabilis]|uniref:hypothetical protein n=1 Tax=Streptomyces mirabilis TaxID=68239 RepID=UPI003666F914